jgi:hAT family C-terminal dimerisation region
MSDMASNFGNISMGRKALIRSELEEYLALPVEKVKDPLKWWFENSKAYPNLSKMAFDYLSAPGKSNIYYIPSVLIIISATSTVVERVFSQGRQILHFTRNRLKGSSIRAYLCLGSWGRLDMLRIEDIVKVITVKKRSRSDSEEI